ncbi:MAG: orotidine-5'-phosphate decarboxylase [Myxococcales bacterium]|nr:orotidine-5'-phosphate decarboxylase [Myxococcales bacterium]
MSRAREHLALAADLPLDEARALYRRVRAQVAYAKVGLSLFVRHGPAAVAALLEEGAKVFLDLKLHDIPNTVRLAAEEAGALGASLLTVHASGGEAMLSAAVEGAREGAARVGRPAPRVLAVTVLTSMDDSGLLEVGVRANALEQALHLAELARRAGAHGVVCSAREASAVRSLLGPGALLCTPGIRPVGFEAGDQARVETPSMAIRAGADLLVVGRPIYAAPEPQEAAEGIASEVEAALR